MPRTRQGHASSLSAFYFADLRLHPVPNLSQREVILTCVEEYKNIGVWNVTPDAEGNPVVTIAAEQLP
jgi:hypothetical protein